mmetsp:Transcript_43280/g.90634  ORF Transcript_43280/g.90634 Transcript_43280/m.90634 type:complete len:191 (+) Transcript_43280:561-1133(+)
MSNILLGSSIAICTIFLVSFGFLISLSSSDVASHDGSSRSRSSPHKLENIKELGTFLGILEQLIRIQDISQAIQRQIVAAEPQIRDELERLQVVRTTPKEAGDIPGVRETEINMRRLIHLYERATRSQAQSQEDGWCDKLLRHLVHAEAAAHYLNEATRSNIVRKATDLMILRKHGPRYTVSATWQEISR